MKIMRIVYSDGMFHCIGQTSCGTIVHKKFKTYLEAVTYGEKVIK
jgi:DNA-directed RNA polymerase subunit N (RpoN/RPB10)